MQKKLFSFFIVAILVAQSILLSSCSREKTKFSAYSFDFFDTVTTIVGYEENKEEFDRVTERIFDELKEYHRLYTIYHRFEGLENLCTVNELKNGEHRTVSVDDKIIHMLLYAKEMYELTDGKVNVAMGSVLSIWHDYRTEGSDDPVNAKLPPMDKLIEASKYTDIDGLIIDEEAGTVTLANSRMRLDVGAIAKGYATEMVAQSLEREGITGYVLNVGGNVRSIGTKADGAKWTVGIENPAESEEEPYLAYLELSGESLVTSGSYQRYYIVDGERYHHIIDPETLMPSEGYRSVSIVCESSALGDALSTALFCMDIEEGQDLIKGLDNVEAMWVTEDGTIYYSDGFKNYIKAENQYTTQNKILFD